MKILVTTNLKETYGKEEEILFAGDWVKSSLSFEKDWGSKNLTTDKKHSASSSPVRI